MNLFVLCRTHSGVFGWFVKFMCANYRFRILEFVGVFLMPKIDICLIQVIDAANCRLGNTQFFGNSGKVTGVWELTNKMDVWLFEVAGFPFWCFPIVLFCVAYKIFLGVYVLVMECPGTGEICLCIFNLFLLALWIKNEHALPGTNS